MDLRRTGSEDELLFLQTPSLTVTLKGPASHPEVPGIHYDQKSASVRVKSIEDFSLSLPADAGTVASICSDRSYFSEYSVRPLFFEQQQYELVVEPTEGHTVSFWHENYSIRSAITPVGRAQRMLSGVINFANDIGYSDLVFILDGRDEITVTVEVFPTKISYKEDYRALIADVTAEVYNLVFDFLRRTYSSFDIGSNAQSSPVEFYAIIHTIYTKFVAAADTALRSPHHLLQKELQVLPGHKIKQYDGNTLKWLRKHPEAVLREGDTIQVSRAMSVRKYVTYDTRENRLTKYMLEQTAKRLEHFRDLYRLIREDGGPDTEAIREINGMITGIWRRCHTGFLKEVQGTTGESGTSLVFQMAPGYRDIYRYYLMLQHGLALTGSIFNLSVKDLAVLYEYWCFVKLNSLLKKRYRLITSDIIRVNGSGLMVNLAKGQLSQVRYIDEKNGDQILLTYNPTKSRMPTLTQRPDNVLSLIKKGSSINYEYIFDAKYRIDPAVPGSYYHRFIFPMPGPKEEDINTMHRYRDAIVSEAETRFERGMVGAYILFPYANEEEYQNHRFYKSIDKVNIGGLPFLPSATRLVGDMLGNLIDDSTESAFERMSLPRGIETKLQKVEWNKKDVMIGTLRSPEQLEICLQHQFYYLPVRNLPDQYLPVRYVALYQSSYVFGKEAQIAYYGEVKRIQKVKRKEIREIRCQPERAEQDYYYVEIRQWRKLARPIQAKGSGIRSSAFTNEFLFRHAETVSEIFLKSPEEFRFLTELKRFANSLSVINREERPVGFEFGEHRVLFLDGKIQLIHGGQIISQSEVKDFIKHPNATFRGMMNVIKG